MRMRMKKGDDGIEDCDGNEGIWNARMKHGGCWSECEVIQSMRGTDGTCVKGVLFVDEPQPGRHRKR